MNKTITKAWLLNQRQRVLLYVVLLQIPVVISLLIDASEVVFLFPQVISGLFLLVFIPGYLIYSIFGIDHINIQDLPIIVGISLAVVMIFGFLLNTVSIVSQIDPDPFTSTNTILSYLLFINLLLIFYGFKNNKSTFAINLEGQLRYVMFALVLPILALTTSYLVNNYSISLPAFALLIIISITPIVLINTRSEEDAILILLYAIAFSLLVQNIWRTPIFSPAGDTPYEYYFANITLAQEFWNTSYFATKNTIPRLRVLFPIYKLVMGTSLLYQFTVVHQLLFALIVIPLYKMYKIAFGSRIAIFSTLCFVFFDQFFRIMSRETRTGTALLFIALVLYLISTKKESSFVRFQIVLFSVGVLFSHYGTALIFLLILIISFIGWLLLGKVNFTTNKNPFSVYVILTVGVITYIWFSYLASGRAFSLVVNKIIQDFLFGVRGFFSVSSGPTRLATSSLTLESSTLIRIGYALIALLAGFGYLLYLWSRRRDHTTRESVFLVLPVPAFLTIVLAFAPQSIFGINRIYIIVSICFVPLAFFLLQKSLRRIQYHNQIIAVLLCCLLLLNSGVVAVGIYNEIPQQPNIVRGDILEDGSNTELQYLFARYNSKYDYQATKWLFDYKVDNIVAGPGGFNRRSYLSYYFADEFTREDPPGGYTVLNETNKNSGYVFISYLAQETGQINGVRRSRAVFADRVNISEFNLHRENKIYTTGVTNVQRKPPSDSI